MTYVLLSVFWTLAGLVVGYYLGRAGRPSPDPTDPGEPTVPAPTRTRSPVRRDHALGAGLVVLALLSVIGTAVFVSRQQQLTERQAAVVECQNRYNRAFATALDQRNEAAAKERDGQRRLLVASFSRDPDPEAVLATYRAYLALLAEADAQRDANPLPERVC